MASILAINELRKCFNVSIACFNVIKSISNVFESNNKAKEMYDLYLKTKQELNKENPDLEIIDKLLSDIKNLTQK